MFVSKTKEKRAEIGIIVTPSGCISFFLSIEYPIWNSDTFRYAVHFCDVNGN